MCGKNTKTKRNDQIVRYESIRVPKGDHWTDFLY